MKTELSGIKTGIKCPHCGADEWKIDGNSLYCIHKENMQYCCFHPNTLMANRIKLKMVTQSSDNYWKEYYLRNKRHYRLRMQRLKAA